MSYGEVVMRNSRRSLVWMSVVAMVVSGVLAGIAGSAAGVRSSWENTTGFVLPDVDGPHPVPTASGGPATISDASAASIYPWTINVPSSKAGRITDLNVTLTDLSHGAPDDLDVLLVGPSGEQVTLMSDAGSGVAITNEDLVFDDEAATVLPDTTALTSTSYRPGNYGTPPTNDIYPTPAPSATGSTSLAVFDGTLAAGEWKLFIRDDRAIATGSLVTWRLDITQVPTSYPSTITVSGLTRVQDVDVTLTGLQVPVPDDVDIMLVGPQGQQVTLLSDSGGGSGWLGRTFVLDDQATEPAPDGPFPSTLRVLRPGNFDTLTDPYPPPAPASTGGTSLSVFNGTDPNGVWSLFVIDDAPGVVGSIDGWSLSIETDQAAPSGTVTIDNGAATTATTAVTLGLTATDPAPNPSGLDRMRFSNDGISWSDWQPFTTSAAWTLAPGPDGARTVHAQFIDASGNISTVVNDTIQVTTPPAPPDTAAPTWTRLVPKKKAKNVSRTVTIKIFASEALNPGTVTGKTVFLKRKGVAKAVKAKVSYNAAKKLIVLNPSVTLAKHKTYRVTVTPKVTDLARNAFDGNPGRTGTQNLRWIFVTR